MRVLIAEDERALADVLEHIIRRAGHQAETVYNGREGLNYA